MDFDCSCPYHVVTWASQHALLLALLWPLLISAVFLPLSATKFRKLGN